MIAAVAIAVSLWVAALWLRSNETPVDELPEEDPIAVATLVFVESGVQHA